MPLEPTRAPPSGHTRSAAPPREPFGGAAGFQTLEAGKHRVTNKTRAAVHASAQLRVLSVERSHTQRSGPGCALGNWDWGRLRFPWVPAGGRHVVPSRIPATRGRDSRSGCRRGHGEGRGHFARSRAPEQNSCAAASGPRRARTRVGVGGRGTAARGVRALPPPSVAAARPRRASRGRAGGEQGVGPRPEGPERLRARAGVGRGRLRSRWRRGKMVELEAGATGEQLHSQAWHGRCH